MTPWGRRPLAWAAGGLAACLVAALALGLLWPQLVLTVRLIRQAGRLQAARLVRPGDTIVLSYLHSVERTGVKGIFQALPGGCLRLQATLMGSLGSGLPARRARPAPGGGLLAPEADGRIGVLRFYYLPLNRLGLQAAGRPVPLGRMPAGSLLAVSLERIPRWRALAWRWLRRSWSPSTKRPACLRRPAPP